MQMRPPIAAPDQDARRARELSNYWRIRLTTAIDQLEREARRMLQLEEELGAFATRYYEAISEPVQRLDALEMQLPDPKAKDLVPEFNDIVTQCQARAGRRVELKKRYRSLAQEIHPDRAMVIESTGFGASSMSRLNVAYQKGDLAALLKLDAELMVAELCGDDLSDTALLESALYEIKRASDTYADGYRTLLGSPLNTLMLRSMSARIAGWDLVETVKQKVEQRIEEKERALFTAVTAMSETEWAEPTQMM